MSAAAAGAETRLRGVGPADVDGGRRPESLHVLGRNATAPGSGARLVGKPLVLITDEPATGLDPGSRIELWRFLDELVQEGTTVLPTTQYLEEAERVADRIAVLERGTLIASGIAAEPVEDLGVRRPSLDDVLLTLTGVGETRPNSQSHGGRPHERRNDRGQTAV
jgi:ABC-type multidrug transport system ATPase subunit